MDDLHAEATWSNMSGPIAWVQKQMNAGISPRTVLEHLMPSGVGIPDNLDEMSLWKAVIDVLSEPPKRKKLNDINLIDDVIYLIQQSKNIVVLTGAGVSVSCGIPDFRSKDGIYSRLAVEYPDLPDPQAMFDIHYFRKNQKPFFKFAKEIYPGQFKPSTSHKFIKLIEDQGKLLRNFTQNIDTLEQVAGIKNVIQCHGSFVAASCMNCKHKVHHKEIEEDIMKQVIPRCPKCPSDAESAVMKPDIVFFGESLPEEFHKQMESDRDKCDLLIVMGSALKVRPVALIPNSLPASVPQILINREPLKHLNFDIELLGDCDYIVQELCFRLGGPWTSLCVRKEPATEMLRSEMKEVVVVEGDDEEEDGGDGSKVASDTAQDVEQEAKSAKNEKDDNADKTAVYNESESPDKAATSETDKVKLNSSYPDCSKVSNKAAASGDVTHSAADVTVATESVDKLKDSAQTESDKAKAEEVPPTQTKRASECQAGDTTSTSRDTPAGDAYASRDASAAGDASTSRDTPAAGDASTSRVTAGGSDVTPTTSVTSSRVVVDDKPRPSTSRAALEDADADDGSRVDLEESCDLGDNSMDDSRDVDVAKMRSFWKPRFTNLAKQLRENTFLYVPPSRYIFEGADFLQDLDEVSEGSLTSSEYSDSDDDKSAEVGVADDDAAGPASGDAQSLKSEQAALVPYGGVSSDVTAAWPVKALAAGAAVVVAEEGTSSQDDVTLSADETPQPPRHGDVTSASSASDDVTASASDAASRPDDVTSSS